MQARGRFIRLGGILIVGLLSVATLVRSQASQSTWEYASVNGRLLSGGDIGAKICYATPQGCRYEEISITRTRSTQNEDFLMAAAAKLGTQGWELTGAADSSTNSLTSRALYFRRQNSK